MKFRASPERIASNASGEFKITLVAEAEEIDNVMTLMKFRDELMEFSVEYAPIEGGTLAGLMNKLRDQERVISAGELDWDG